MDGRRTNGSDTYHGTNKATPTEPKTQAGQGADTDSLCIGLGRLLTKDALKVSNTNVTAAAATGKATSFKIWSFEILMCAESPTIKSSATAATKCADCNRNAMPPFAAHG